MHLSANLRRLAREFVAWNRSISRCQRELAERWLGRRNGYQVFLRQRLPELLRPGLRVLDVGGGRSPLIAKEDKAQLNLHVTGLDIDAQELALAPAGCYDDVLVGDVASVFIPAQFDLIISATVLEHVADPNAALSNLSSALRPGGQMAHFLPCGNAPFAIVNRALGPARSRELLLRIYPEKDGEGGFPAYYSGCSPRVMTRQATDAGLRLQACDVFFASEYLSFFAPLHLLDVLRQSLLQHLGCRQFCESFCFVAHKPQDGTKAAA